MATPSGSFSSSSEDRMPPRKIAAVLVTYAAAFTHGVAVVSYPASASVLKAHALSDAAYGTIFLPQMIGTLIGSILGGRARSQRRTLALSLVAAAIAEVLLYASPSAGIVTAMVGTTALGLGFGLAAAPLNGLPGQLFPNRAESALVLLHSVLASGFAIGPVLASRAIEMGHFSRLPFGVGCTAAILAAAALVAVPPAHEVGEAVERDPVSAASHLRLLFMAIVVLYALAEGTFANWAVVYLREERGIADAPAALALSMFWLSLTLGRLTVSALLRTVPAELIWPALPVAMLAAFLALPFVSTPALAILGFAFAGLACSAFFPLSVSLAAKHFPGGAARASALLTAALMIGVGIGSFVIGPLRSASSIATLYRVSALYPLIAVALCVQALAWGRVPRRGVVD